MKLLATCLLLIGTVAAAAPQPHVDSEKPATAIDPHIERQVESCLARQQRQRGVIVIIRDGAGNVIAIGAIKVRQRC